MSEWTKIQTPNASDLPKAIRLTEKEKQTVEGVYLERREHLGNNDSTIHVIEQKDGTQLPVWGTAVVDLRLKNIPFGDKVKIVYLGKTQHPKDKKKSLHNFDVFHKPSASSETKTEVTSEDSDKPDGSEDVSEDLPF